MRLTRRNVAKGTLAAPLLYLQARHALGGGSYDNGIYDEDCGVTSGSPMPDSVVIWTRVPGSARFGVGPADSLPVRYEVASTEDFAPGDIVAEGIVTTDATRDFTVKQLVGGLSPFTTYHYRFRTDSGFASAVGRTKTAPPAGSKPDRLRVGLAVCQKMSAGQYAAFGAMAKEDFDVCVHLGDHIYENEKGRGGSGDPLGREAKSLDDYRKKYRYYLSDPLYREARRQFCWIDMWDDHEVFNDHSSADRIADPERFAAAYRAFLDYMPIAHELIVAPGTPPEIELYRTVAFGDLAELVVTDERQYRKPNACHSKYFTKGCAAMWKPEQSMFGAAQNAWVRETLGASRCTWKLLLSEVMMSPVKAALSSGAETTARFLNLDQWDGYPTERQELLAFIQDQKIQNAVVCSGDIHAAFDAYLYPDLDQTSGRAAALEIVTTSISSETLADRVGKVLGALAQRILTGCNPQWAWSDIKSNGYTSLTLTPEAMDIVHMGVHDVSDAASPVTAVRQTRVLAGVPEFR